jgi:serine/threonine-protein kinase
MAAADAATRRPPLVSGERIRRLFGWGRREDAAATVPGPQAPYQLGRRLDRAESGDVYEATHPRLLGSFAVKLVRPGVGASPEAVQAFRLDATVVAGLHHPHCAQVLDIGTTVDGVPFLVMELLEGETLDQYLDRRRSLPADQASELITAIASALAAAHTVKVVHGDLRPEKIFLAQAAGYAHGFAKVMGFGPSRLIAIGDRLAAAQRVEAAPFAGPELGTAGFDPLDARIDQFALAAIAYRVLAGANAFPGADGAAIRRRLLGEAPRPLPVSAHYGRAVDPVLRRGLAKAPHQRYPSVTAFAQALDDALSHSAPNHVTEVTSGQILMASPIVPTGPAPQVELDDEVSQGFFAEGNRIETTGVEHEVEPVPVHSLDRIPRNRRPFVVLALLALLGTAPVAWWAGWRPPQVWQQSWVWQTLHLPSGN